MTAQKTDIASREIVNGKPQVLVVDIGGTHVKLFVSGKNGKCEFVSGPNLTPKKMIAGIRKLVPAGDYDVVSIGYPGPISQNRPISEPWNLGKGCISWRLALVAKQRVPCGLCPTKFREPRK